MSETHQFKNAMRVYAAELICNTGVSGFQTFKPAFCIYNTLRLHAEILSYSNNNNNLFIYSALFNMLGDQKRITTVNNLKTINTNIKIIQTYLISKRC